MTSSATCLQRASDHGVAADGAELGEAGAEGAGREEGHGELVGSL